MFFDLLKSRKLSGPSHQICFPFSTKRSPLIAEDKRKACTFLNLNHCGNGRYSNFCSPKFTDRFLRFLRWNIEKLLAMKTQIISLMQDMKL